MWRRALGSVKDQASIGIAIVGGGFAPDIEVALVKATSHDEEPIDERYVQELLHLISFSRAYVNACVTSIAKRLSKTHNWVVAIKALILTHRLLVDADPSFEHELGFGRSGRGGSMRILNLSNFRDDSHSHAWDYSAFVRTYALFLDEKLDLNLSLGSSHSIEGGSAIRRTTSYDGYGFESRKSYNGYGHRDGGYGSGRDDEDDERYRNNDDYRERRRRENGSHGRDDRGSGKGMKKKASSFKDMTILELVERIPLVQRLLERVLACRPTGYARMNRLVQIALYPVVNESFQLYYDISNGLARVFDAFFDMDYADCVKVFDIYTKGAKQIDELISFYGTCKTLGICRSSEYPTVAKISEESIETMEDFLRDRSEASRSQKKKSLETIPRSPERAPSEADDDDTNYDTINGMKALPAPPLPEESEPEVQPPKGVEPDLLGLNADGVITAEEHGNELALALFAETAPSSQAQASNGRGQAWGDRALAGWELALVESESELSRPNSAPNGLAGGFDNLLLTSMYDQATTNRKAASMMPSGSASSVALPGRPASSFLALPAPAAQSTEEDPFAASLNVPPPSYVQMSDMRQKQQLLLQEQQVWRQYQADGMQGYNGLMKFYSPGYNNNAFQPLPYYGASYY